MTFLCHKKQEMEKFYFFIHIYDLATRLKISYIELQYITVELTDWPIYTVL